MPNSKLHIIAGKFELYFLSSLFPSLKVSPTTSIECTKKMVDGLVKFDWIAFSCTCVCDTLFDLYMLIIH